MPIPEKGGFESSGEFDPPHPLLTEHGEDRADVRFRAGQQVVVQNVAAGMDREFP